MQRTPSDCLKHYSQALAEVCVVEQIPYLAENRLISVQVKRLKTLTIPSAVVFLDLNAQRGIFFQSII